ncbi:MAG: hypothetical protein ACJAYC_002729 [Halieaceae bacterium]|jgi:hypothetical protein
MTQKRWIARAGRGLLDVLKLLLRGAGVLCATFGSILLFIFQNEGPKTEESTSDAATSSDHIVGQDEAEHYGWDSW